MNKNIYGIFFKISSFNILIFSILFFFLIKGWLTYIFEEDQSYISLIIVFSTILTVLYLNVISFKINILQNLLAKRNIEKFESIIFKNLNEEKNKTVENLHLVLFSKIYFAKQISLIATLMGLLGTVLGFIVVLLFIDFSLLKDVENLQEVLKSISKGMGIALYTTLVGTFCSLWIYILYILMNFDIKKLCFGYSTLKNRNLET